MGKAAWRCFGILSNHRIRRIWKIKCVRMWLIWISLKSTFLNQPPSKPYACYVCTYSEKKICHFRFEANFIKQIWFGLTRLGPGQLQFFKPPNLEGYSFAATWAMVMKSSSFESPKPYLFALNLKNSIAALLKSVRTSWKVPTYYTNGVLMILNSTAL